MRGHRQDYDINRMAETDRTIRVISEDDYAKDFRELQKQVTTLYDDQTADAFLENLVQFLGTRQARLPKEQGALSKHVGSEMDDILVEVMKDERFNGSTVSIGSSSEGTKVTSANEFDYLLVLDTVTGDDIHVEAVSRPTVYKLTDPEKIPKSYCDVYLKELNTGSKQNDDDGDAFIAPNEESSERISLWSNERFMSDNRKMLSARVQQEFKSLVQSVVLNKYECQSHVTTKGPAVTIYLKTDSMSLIKIDLSVALKLQVSQLPGNIQSLVENTASLGISNHDCYLIPSGDYWKISLCLAEKDYINSLDDKSKLVYKAIKVFLFR